MADRVKPLDPAPVLTFYQELTAPLTSPPPPAKSKSATPAGTQKENGQKSGEPRSTAALRAASASPPATEHIDLPAATSGTDPAAPVITSLSTTTTRYTVQVGAFRLREQAEAVRARLAAAGHDAFIADLESPAATRYRVRIGAYASRDEARRAAERVTATERFATYVTVR